MSYYASTEYAKNPFVDDSPKVTVIVNNTIQQRSNVVEEVATAACACCMLNWLLSPFHFFRLF